MDPQIQIRQAFSQDARIVADLSLITFRDAFAGHPKNAPDDLNAYMSTAFNLDRIADELLDEMNIFLLAEIDGQPAGYAKLILDSIEDGISATRPIELSRLYSHQIYLGRGVGQALMNECFRYARKLEHDVIWLGVWEYNPRALAFYKRNGFNEVGKHIFQLGTDPQTDLLMQQSL